MAIIDVILPASHKIEQPDLPQSWPSVLNFVQWLQTRSPIVWTSSTAQLWTLTTRTYAGASRPAFQVTLNDSNTYYVMFYWAGSDPIQYCTSADIDQHKPTDSQFFGLLRRIEYKIRVTNYWAGANIWNVGRAGTIPATNPAGQYSGSMQGYVVSDSDTPSTAQVMFSFSPRGTVQDYGGFLTQVHYYSLQMVVASLRIDNGLSAVWEFFGPSDDLFVSIDPLVNNPIIVHQTNIQAVDPEELLNMSLAGIESRLAEIRDNVGSIDAHTVDVTAQIAAVVAALGVGGVFGSLATGGTIAEGVSKLNPILSAISGIGNVANAIQQYAQTQELGRIADAAEQMATTTGDINYHAARIKDSLWAPPAQEGEDPDTLRGRLASIGYEVHQCIPADPRAAIDAVASAIYAACGGGGGGTVDLSPVVDAIDQLRAAISAGGGGLTEDQWRDIFRSCFVADPGDADAPNLAAFIRSLINTGWIIYR